LTPRLGDEDFVGTALDEWKRVRLFTGRLCVRFKGMGVNRRSTPWARSFVSAAPVRSIFQALARR